MSRTLHIKTVSSLSRKGPHLTHRVIYSAPCKVGHEDSQLYVEYQQPRDRANKMGQKQSSETGFQHDYSHFRLSSPLGDIKANYDVIIIGSGYGGSICASRCARAGQSVCVLEKGKEWLPGDFPETEFKAIKEVQMTVKGKKDLVGSPTNLYDIVVGDDVVVLQGCGLGGGSLINANVGLDIDPRVYQDKAWPQAIRDEIEIMNKIDRDHVHDMLKPNVYPDEGPFLHKMEAMKTAAEHIAKDIEDIQVDDIFKRIPLYVNFVSQGKNHVGIPQPACVGCGNCCGGCNTGAKNTLNMNYLPDAKSHGAEIYTQVEVKYIMRDDEQELWTVRYVPHIQEAYKKRELIIRAKTVIISAGSLGSTNILMQSRDFGGLNISKRVGENFTTNGDTLNISYNGEKRIGPAGVELKNLKDCKAPGPAIVSVIDMRGIPGEHFEEGLVLEDGTPPSCADAPYKFLVSWIEKGEDTTPGENDWREKVRHWSGKGWKNTLCFLSMSHDKSDGKLVLDDKSGRVMVEYKGVGHEGNFEKVRKTARSATHGLKGFFIPNPYWNGLVSRIRHTKGIVTVHPLGGCIMAESGKDGVVNHAGQVFRGDTDELQPGLFVIDGAIIPRSLGVNPTMTIAILAERCMRIMAKQNGWHIDYKTFTKIDPSSVMAKPGIRFTEHLHGNLYFNEGNGLQCEVILTVEINNVKKFLEDKTHVAKIYGTMTCKELSQCHLTISNGHFQMIAKRDAHKNAQKMIYRMVLSSVEGKMYFFDGVKVIHKESTREVVYRDKTTFAMYIYEGDNAEGKFICKGNLEVEPRYFRKQMKTIEVFNVRSKLERFRWKSKFGKFFAGALWDVYGSLATSKNVFCLDAPPREKRQLELGDSQPEVTTLYTLDDYQLLLTRYQGGSKGPLLLVHGTGVSSSIFTLDTIDKNFIEYLVEHEYDVWNLDWRGSANLAGCRKQWSCDEVGKYDFRVAIDYILNKTGKPDLQVFIHCAGGIVFYTCLLQGHLQGKVRSIFSSQTGPCLVAGKFNTFKSAVKIPSFLHGVGVDGMDAFVENADDWIKKVTGRFFEGVADVTTAFKEHCDNPVCHRITFIYHLLWNHHNLNALTHDTLHEIFGYVNSTILRHFAKSVKKGHLVTFQGHDKYMPGANSKERLKNPEYKKQMAYLDIPTMFCSGLDNKCWHPDTSKFSMELCREANPHQHYERLLIPNYAHLDLFMGKNAATEVFPLFMPFLDKYAHTDIVGDILTPRESSTFF